VVGVGPEALAEAEHISKRLAIVMVACIAPMPLT